MFMTHANADGLAEIQVGQMALERSSDPKVKQWAQRIVDDHTDANTKLRVLARDKQVTLPVAPPVDARDKAVAMTNLDGTKFDQAWAAAMVSDHQQAVATFADEIKRTQDPEIQAFANGTLPTLKSHLELAPQLQRH